MFPQIVTIGVYGSSEEAFFRALQEAGVDTFCDIRQRRGVRGSEYAFVNSTRLQARLAEMGIRYLHRRDLAPTPAIRAQQHAADKLGKTARRQRAQLDPRFVAAYEAEILAGFDPAEFLAALAPSRVAALFCVERDAAACHRSLLAARLHREAGVEVEHLQP